MKYFLSFILTFLLSSTALYGHERIRDYDAFNPSGEFELIDQNNDVFKLSDHRGKVVLLFFGFLSCPDVCPLTMSKLTAVYSQLTEQQREKVLTAFVTLDPERDTPERIKEYLGYFDIEAYGLTSPREKIDEVVEKYKAYYEFTRTKSALGYLIDHTSYIYLIDKEGKVKYLFRPEDGVKHIREIIEEFLLKD